MAILAVVTACGLLLGQPWGRLGGGLVAVVNSLVSFAFLDRYPWWAVTVVVFSVVTLWALVAHGDEVAGVYADR